MSYIWIQNILITKAAFNNRKFMNNLAFVDQIHVQFACQVARGHGGRGGGNPIYELGR